MSETGNPTVEICAQGLASALAAGEGGADRVELCEHLAVGGVTPGPGAIAVACDRLAIPVQVLVRPRGGDFAYGRAELEAMRLDVLAAKKVGASGVVLGILDARGEIDRDRVARLVDQARPMAVTFHRAFDEVPDPIAGLDALIGLGVDRVLSSGQAPTARHGLATLAELVRHASGRIAILAGGGITSRDLSPLAAAGLGEVHAGSALAIDGTTDADLVRRFVAAAREAFAAPPRRASGAIWHLISRSAWEEAVTFGEPLRPASLATEGFIHASEDSEVAESANRFYRGCLDLVALRIDPSRLRVPLAWEYAPDRDAWFPHLFGPLDPASVASVVPVRADESGHFTWP